MLLLFLFGGVALTISEYLITGSFLNVLGDGRLVGL